MGELSLDLITEFGRALLDHTLSLIALNVRLGCVCTASGLGSNREPSWSGGSYENDSDEDCFKHGNVHFAMWASQLLLEASSEASAAAVMAGGMGSSRGHDTGAVVEGQRLLVDDNNSKSSVTNDEPSSSTPPTTTISPTVLAHHLDWVTPVCRVWSHVLRSASMSFKHVAFSVLSELLSSLRHHALGGGGGHDSSDQNDQIDGGERDIKTFSDTTNNENFRHFTALLRQCVAMLPVTRLHLMGAKRLWYEMEDFPVYSRFLQVRELLIPSFLPQPTYPTNQTHPSPLPLPLSLHIPTTPVLRYYHVIMSQALLQLLTELDSAQGLLDRCVPTPPATSTSISPNDETVAVSSLPVPLGTPPVVVPPEVPLVGVPPVVAPPAVDTPSVPPVVVLPPVPPEFPLTTSTSTTSPTDTTDAVVATEERERLPPLGITPLMLPRGISINSTDNELLPPPPGAHLPTASSSTQPTTYGPSTTTATDGDRNSGSGLGSGLSVGSYGPRNVIHFDTSHSHLQLSPQKDLPGPWTVEFWLWRDPSPSSPGSTQGTHVMMTHTHPNQSGGGGGGDGSRETPGDDEKYHRDYDLQGRGLSDYRYLRSSSSSSSSLPSKLSKLSQIFGTEVHRAHSGGGGEGGGVSSSGVSHHTSSTQDGTIGTATVWGGWTNVDSPSQRSPTYRSPSSMNPTTSHGMFRDIDVGSTTGMGRGGGRNTWVLPPPAVTAATTAASSVTSASASAGNNDTSGGGSSGGGGGAGAPITSLDMASRLTAISSLSLAQQAFDGGDSNNYRRYDSLQGLGTGAEAGAGAATGEAEPGLVSSGDNTTNVTTDKEPTDTTAKKDDTGEVKNKALSSSTEGGEAGEELPPPIEEESAEVSGTTAPPPAPAPALSTSSSPPRQMIQFLNRITATTTTPIPGGTTSTPVTTTSHSSDMPSLPLPLSTLASNLGSSTGTPSHSSGVHVRTNIMENIKRAFLADKENQPSSSTPAQPSGSGQGPTLTNGSNNQTAPPVEHKNIIPPVYLLSSSGYSLKLQMGGRSFVGGDVPDPLEGREPVRDQAMCLSLSQVVSCSILFVTLSYPYPPIPLLPL